MTAIFIDHKGKKCFQRHLSVHRKRVVYDVTSCLVPYSFQGGLLTGRGVSSQRGRGFTLRGERSPLRGGEGLLSEVEGVSSQWEGLSSQIRVGRGYPLVLTSSGGFSFLFDRCCCSMRTSNWIFFKPPGSDVPFVFALYK